MLQLLYLSLSYGFCQMWYIISCVSIAAYKSCSKHFTIVELPNTLYKFSLITQLLRPLSHELHYCYFWSWRRWCWLFWLNLNWHFPMKKWNQLSIRCYTCYTSYLLYFHSMSMSKFPLVVKFVYLFRQWWRLIQKEMGKLIKKSGRNW